MASWRVNSDPTPQSLGVRCSDVDDVPIGANDEVDFLFMRQDRLNKVSTSLEECGQLKQHLQ